MATTGNQQKKISVTKIKGTENTADIGTKPVKKEAAEYLMQKMGFEVLADQACERT